MRTVSGWISTTILVTTIVLGSTSVQAGIIVGNFSPSDQKAPCSSQTGKVDWGIIVGNLTGIIVGNLTGIIVGNAGDIPTENCGIIVGN